MPIRRVLILLALFGSCLAIIGLAWISGSDLYLLSFPPRRRHINGPPTPPGIILAVLLVCPMLTLWLGQRGIYVFWAATLGMLVSSAVGFVAFNWTPTWSQHLLVIAMIATSVYAWTQKDYFDE
jgi:hypothetical protein